VENPQRGTLNAVSVSIRFLMEKDGMGRTPRIMSQAASLAFVAKKIAAKRAILFGFPRVGDAFTFSPFRRLRRPFRLSD
jgi:hypothetical protein